MVQFHELTQDGAMNIPQAGIRGFTNLDLSILHQTCTAAIAREGWARGQISSNEFSDYLAIWNDKSSAEALPSRSVVRFKKTGTYALVVGTMVVATGKSLLEILPVLAASAAPLQNDED